MQMKFGLQDPSRIAIKAIETIQMPKTQTIIYYDLEFEKYANQIQDGYYSEQAYVHYYYEGLANRIKKQLMSYQLPNSLKTIQYIIQVIDDQYWDY